MAAKNNIKTPPALREDIPYESWKKEINIWQRFNTLEKRKQALAIFLSLEGKAREVVLEIDIDNLDKDDGVERILTQLDKLYLKDKLQLAYQAYDNFEKFKRPTEMPISEFVVEFERLYNKAKAYEMILPDGILAYKFLNNANITDSHEKLIRATMTALSYNSMKEQLRKIFGDISISISSNKSKPSIDSNPQVKIEPTDEFAYEIRHDDNEYHVKYSNYKTGRSRGRYQSNYRGRPRGNRNFFSYNRGNRNASSYSDKQTEYQSKKNPVKADGITSTCIVCGSVYHWAKDCPDSYENLTKKKNTNDDDVKISLYSDTMKHLVGETLSTAVLDSGCTKNVCGETWLKCYLDTLDEMDLKQVKYQQSSTSFKFGSGERVTSMKVVNIPSIISGRKVFIETDVVNCDLPLLLSKDAMKKAEMNIDFSTDTVRIFGQKQKLLFTSSGHYCIPIGKHIESNENLASTNERNNLILYGEWTKKSFEEKIKAMEKLHRQFSHAPFKRLKNLLLDTGLNDAEMYNILE